MTFETFREKVAQRIKELRVERGLTQEDMDNGKWAVPPRTIQMAEEARGNPTMKTLYEISRTLRVEPKDIFDIK